MTATGGDTVKSLRSWAFGATTPGCSAHAENPSASAGRNVRFVYFIQHLRTGLASTWCYKPQKQRPAKRSVLDEIQDRKSTRLNSSHVAISYAVFCLKKKKK